MQEDIKMVYVVTEDMGMYDDYNRAVDCVFYTEEKAKEYVAKMEATLESMERKMKDFEVLREEWEEKNEVTLGKPPKLKELPKWPGGVTITEKMRKERAEIEEHNKELLDKYNAPMQTYYEALTEFENKWKSENLTEEENKLEQIWDYCISWYIYEVPIQ